MTLPLDGESDFPLTSALDNTLVMHRDVHFAGNFGHMLDYYRNKGKGIHPDIDIPRIEALAEMELQSQENLAGLLLSGSEAEKVAEAKDAYRKLQEIYENPNPKSKNPILIADLILSEENEEEAAIAAIVAEKNTIVPFLIDLLRSEKFHDPLFPGYGLAPELAARCLGLIGDKRAIISLFEFIGRSDFFEESIAIDGLKAIGQPAKEFLLKVLQSKTLTEDNERAAIALLAFKEDPEVSKTCFELIKKKEVQQHVGLANYLVLVCEGLADPVDRNAFLELSQDPNIPKVLKQDMLMTAKAWNEK